MDLSEFALFGVGLDDRLRGRVESDETLLDRLRVVVDATGSLPAEHQTRCHRLVGNVEVEHFVAWLNRLLETTSLWKILCLISYMSVY